jgi:hypothetical protein
MKLVVALKSIGLSDCVPKARQANLPICPKIPALLDVFKDGTSRFRGLIEVIQTGDLIGRFVIYPINFDVSGIPRPARRPHANADKSRMLSPLAKCPFSTGFSEQLDIHCNDQLKSPLLAVCVCQLALWSLCPSPPLEVAGHQPEACLVSAHTQLDARRSSRSMYFPWEVCCWER